MIPFSGTPTDSILYTKASQSLDVSADLESTSTASIQELLNEQKKQEHTKEQEDKADSSTEEPNQEI
jgi:hypothetical protein